jgi:hypothetical protein
LFRREDNSGGMSTDSWPARDRLFRWTYGEDARMVHPTPGASRRGAACSTATNWKSYCLCCAGSLSVKLVAQQMAALASPGLLQLLAIIGEGEARALSISTSTRR